MRQTINQGVWISVFLCCIWPVAFHLLALYITAALRRRDWGNIHWEDFRWPWWSKE